MEIKFAYLDDQRSRKEKILPRRGVIACDFVQSLSCPWYNRCSNFVGALSVRDDAPAQIAQVCHATHRAVRIIQAGADDRVPEPCDDLSDGERRAWISAVEGEMPGYLRWQAPAELRVFAALVTEPSYPSALGPPTLTDRIAVEHPEWSATQVTDEAQRILWTAPIPEWQLSFNAPDHLRAGAEYLRRELGHRMLFATAPYDLGGHLPLYQGGMLEERTLDPAGSVALADRCARRSTLTRVIG